ncbi:MAG TPA: PaaI family thioesterase [Verrucomicrobiota bacterium]|nr:PaaI family thioesterase [Verrucomicrobiales bacterium]HRI12644.1 PaaI family thioesterase [Verrucomicrobiota bacterium]
MEPLPNTRNCFVCGLQNPVGLRLGIATDRRVVEARFQFRREFCGFTDTIHGGLIATVLDEIMVWAVGVGTGELSYCAEMTVRFQRPATPESDILARGELEANKRGRLFLAKGELFNTAGDLLSESTGKYLPIPDELRPVMLADFDTPPAGIFRR